MLVPVVLLRRRCAARNRPNKSATCGEAVQVMKRNLTSALADVVDLDNHGIDDA